MNLNDEELRNSFLDNIRYAFKHLDNVSMIIRFKFIDLTSDFKFEDVVIHYLCYIEFKGITFKCARDLALDIILDNMGYACFTFGGMEYKHGKTQCHGFGDFFGTDEFIFTYVRVKD